MRSTFGLAFLTTLAIVSATDYCSKTLCAFDKPHVACGHNGEFARICPPDARMVDMRPHINEILREHNEKRDLVAGGGLKRFEPAARMATMQWDEELASLAALNVKQCKMKHDECKNTDTFRYAGQNLGSQGSQGYIIEDSVAIHRSINNWFNEHKDCNMKIINSFPGNKGKPYFGHFTVMVTDKNLRVGCAASRYTGNGKNNFLFACNYAYNNMMEQSIYKPSDKPASECKAGRNPDYKNLCSTAEHYYI